MVKLIIDLCLWCSMKVLQMKEVEDQVYGIPFLMNIQVYLYLIGE